MNFNIYKNKKIFISFTATKNPLAIFFINRDSINEYEMSPDLFAQDRHYLKYSFDGKEYSLNINSSMAEAILNEYRVELLDE
jgi:hypothetical protein